MNLALCFSGQLRSAARALDSFHQRFLEDLRDQHTVDVFAHTWDEDTRTNLVGEPALSPDQQRLKAVSAEDFALICDRLQVCDWRREDSHRFWRRHRQCRAHPHILAQTHSWRQCLELQRQYSQATGRRYDLVIKLRYDLIYSGAVDLGEIVSWAWEEGPDRFWSNQVDGQGRINDIIYLAQPSVMYSVARWADTVMTSGVYYEDIIERAVARRGLEAACLTRLINQHRPVSLWYTILRPECRYNPIVDYDRCHEYWVAFYQSQNWTTLDHLLCLTLEDLRADALQVQRLYGHVPPLIRDRVGI